jgi:hypothetical protein
VRRFAADFLETPVFSTVFFLTGFVVFVVFVVFVILVIFVLERGVSYSARSATSGSTAVARRAGR